MPPSAPSHPTDRVVLLLDLDCFYAQCLCVRLGMDASDTALALLQWNSVLAVTYPARQRYNIQRGDSWEAVHRKSQGGKCHAVHVPILQTATTSGTALAETTTTMTRDYSAVASSEALHSAPASLDEEYDRLYNLSEEQQQEARQKELGVRKYSSEGKACIECFRIASAKIFETVHEFLQQHFPSAVLERASIDEFFLDVTSAVVEDSEIDALDLEIEIAVQETVVIGNDPSELQDTGSTEENGIAQKQDAAPSDERILLQRGCWVAHQIRKTVYETLGFTMSAGISVNKTIAKLAASYGKPAGQAVCFPSDIPGLLQATQIRKCRNLGGKLGASVQALLPSDAPTTVGSIARYLSLPTLRSALQDPGTAEWVYHIARGVDHEIVHAKTKSSAVLTKSITAFKSLNFAPLNNSNESTSNASPLGHSMTEAARWIELLAQEVVTRVERDTVRNHRYPRTCNIQYAASLSAGRNNQKNKSKSVRVAFPSHRLSMADKVEQLVQAVPKAIESKEKHVKRSDFRLHRVGLCATDFEDRGAAAGTSIQTYFTAASGKTDIPSAISTNSINTSPSRFATNKTVATAAHSRPTETKRTHDRIGNYDVNKDAVLAVAANAISDSDLEYARKLQAQYDRENRGWQALEENAKKKRLTMTSGSHRIDGFFQKKT